MSDPRTTSSGGSKLSGGAIASLGGLAVLVIFIVQNTEDVRRGRAVGLGPHRLHFEVEAGRIARLFLQPRDLRFGEIDEDRQR